VASACSTATALERHNLRRSNKRLQRRASQRGRQRWRAWECLLQEGLTKDGSDEKEPWRITLVLDVCAFCLGLKLAVAHLA
jgi:hypothetical protein